MKTSMFIKNIEAFLVELTDIFRFTGLFFNNLFVKRFEFDEWINQLYKTV